MLEVPPILLVDEDEIEVVAGAEFLDDVSERGRQLKAAKKEANGNCLSSDRRAIHDLEFGDGLGLIVLIWRCFTGDGSVDFDSGL